VFRRRRRDGEDTGLQPGDGDYPAVGEEAGEDESAEDWADEDLAGEDVPEDEWADEDDLADDEWDEDELADDYDDLIGSDEDEVAGDEDDDATSGRADRAGGRRRGDRADLSDPATWTRLRDSQTVDPAMMRAAGPWDSASEYPEGERIDFGSLLVPVREGFDVQVFLSDEEGVSIAVVHRDSGLQLQPFAAPRSAGLWAEVRPEIAEEVAKAGGTSSEQDGPFGPELLATVVPQGAEGTGVPPQPLRFMGADGPRWFLRGLISGPAATDRELAEPLEEIFSDVVVVRGDHAVPPRKPLDIALPDEARQVLEGQLESQQQENRQEQNGFNPFERGPEITETR
jgi:Protein of unknown function (DUF3710)